MSLDIFQKSEDEEGNQVKLEGEGELEQLRQMNHYLDSLIIELDLILEETRQIS